MSDKELVEQIVNNDNQRAFETLVNRYQQKVINICMGFTASTDEAKDISQEVFIEVYLSLRKFRQESAFSTWLYRIAVNKSINATRQAKKKLLVRLFTKDNANANELLIPADAGAMPDAKMTKKEDYAALKQAIKSLPENQHIAFTLNKYQELSYKEIAEVMDISLSAVESLIFRAKISLQKKLAEHFNKKA
ncbi:MAG: sigma-70 family RNA polymerase sigma factor [Bacteroidales bacterium]|nr:sigma-70 family RNA polymerase sigma factor [Bacteroidales bacterium]MBN2750237.1 sigma-70 family RNA polymerase sigma factor [Bacteroidales bacterium]